MSMFRIADATLDRMLAEDAPYGDLTTLTLGIAGQSGRMTFAARAAMTVCCTEEAERLLARLPQPRPLIAAAGGIHEDNAAAYAATGADILVTSAPYAAKPADVKVTITAA